jgi:hypothetical protein
MVVYWATWDTNYRLFLAIVLGLVLLAVGRLVSPKDFPALDWRSSSWVLPWLGGLALISYLGAYGDKAQKLYGLGVGAVLTLAASAAIYAWAYYVRLPGQRVRAITAPDEGRGDNGRAELSR